MGPRSRARAPGTHTQMRPAPPQRHELPATLVGVAFVTFESHGLSAELCVALLSRPLEHDFDLIVRAHQVTSSAPVLSSRTDAHAGSQVVEDGYEFFAKRQLVTIFSAPNYCGEFDNYGAMMSVDDTLMCSFQVGVNSCSPLVPPPASSL